MEYIVSILLVLLILYLINSHFLNYWRRHGFPQMPHAVPFFGNISDLFLFRKSFPDCFIDFYEKFKSHPFIGGYFSYKPILLVNDPDLIQDILVRNFSSFTDRPRFVDEKRDPISGHLFNIGGQKWRDLRFKLTPIFSSSKLKGIFAIMKNSGKDLQSFLVRNVEGGKTSFNFNDLLAKYTTNIIVAVIFSLESDTLNDPDDIFRKMSATFTQASRKQHVIDIFSFLIPNILHFLSRFHVKMVTPRVNDFMLNYVKRAIDYREETSCVRADFLQLLIQLKKQGYAAATNHEETEAKSGEKEIKKLTDNEIAAQVLVFFVGGFETSTATMTFCLYELCRNPQLQQKVQEEIDTVFGSIDTFDELSYEMINSLKYLDCCIDETLRLYPPLSILFRRCTKDYQIPNTNLIVEKGTSIHIPAIAIHRDSNIYENAHEFMPERFAEAAENGKGLPMYSFGNGPRRCIGERMAKLQTKVGLSSILWKFSAEFVDESCRDKSPDLQKTQFFLRPAQPFNFKLTPRN